ncbi:hypothetical protein PG987_000133 [Apiospora arundinis]
MNWNLAIPSLSSFQEDADKYCCPFGLVEDAICGAAGKIQRYATQPLAHHDKCEEIEQETDGLLLHCDPAMPHSPLCLTPLYHPPIPSTYTKDEEGYVWLAGREDTTS